MEPASDRRTLLTPLGTAVLAVGNVVRREAPPPLDRPLHT